MKNTNSNIKEITELLKKDLTIEWRNKYSLIGFGLYLASIITICNLSFLLERAAFEAIIWNTLFWIIILFTAINAIAKSFLQESESRQLYFYTVADPRNIIISKILYNVLIMLCLSSLAYVLYSVFLGNPVKNQLLFLFSLGLGATAFSASLTMVSAIASKTNNPVLMAILSFPIIIPVLLVTMSISNQALLGSTFTDVWQNIITLFLLILIVFSTSYVLFPYLWRGN